MSMNLVEQLAEELGCNSEEITELDEHTYGDGVMLEHDGKRYAVYENEDKAHDAAVEWSKAVIEDTGLPNLDIEQYISKSWVEELADEEADVHAEDEEFDRNEDGKTENEVEADLRDKFCDALDDFDINPDVVEEQLDALVEKALDCVKFEYNEDGKDKDAFKEEYKNEIIDDPLGYLRNFYTEDELVDFLKEKDAIDIDEMAEDCVSIDGVAHALASYDGEEIELCDGAYAYRVD